MSTTLPRMRIQRLCLDTAKQRFPAAAFELMHMPRERAIQASVCVLAADPHGAKAFFGGSRGTVRSAGETVCMFARSDHPLIQTL